jgi:hypothetical protein
LANRIVLSRSNMATPYFATAAALMTYSPFDRYAGMLSLVPVPGP